MVWSLKILLIFKDGVRLLEGLRRKSRARRESRSRLDLTLKVLYARPRTEEKGEVMTERHSDHVAHQRSHLKYRSYSRLPSPLFVFPYVPGDSSRDAST